MARATTVQKITELLDQAGITINGTNPWDIVVKHEAFYDRVIKSGTLGLGESYMDGWWECKDLDELFFRLFKNKIHKKYTQLLGITSLIDILQTKLKSKSNPYEVGQKHYDIGNDLYKQMLGETMAYSCGYWKNSKTLDEAQYAKFDLICRKLKLEPNMSVIDIGCGWGGLLKYMVEKYKVRAVGLTVSIEQKNHIDQEQISLGVECHLMDYREFSKISEEKFDRVVSVGMFEHVGLENYSEFMQCVDKMLKDGGLFLLHTIGNPVSDNVKESWLDTYIFPNSKIPSVAQLIIPTEELFEMEDWHNFGLDYAKTLQVWYENFNSSWDSIKDKYGDRFYRMWKYYLLSCIGSFKARHTELWQVVLSKNNYEYYESVR